MLGRHRLHSRDAQREAQRSVLKYQESAFNLLFCIPADLGYQLETVLKNRRLAFVFLFFSDTSVFFQWISRKHHRELSQVEESYLAFPKNYLGPLAAVPWIKRKGMLILKNQVLYQTQPALCEKLIKSIDESSQNYLANILTRRKFDKLWLRQFIRNFISLKEKEVRTPVLDGRPVLFIGAGPGLNRDLDDIAREQEKYQILTLDSALPTLIKKNIQVDMVFAMDSGYYNSKDFSIKPNYAYHLILELRANHHILREHQGPVSPIIQYAEANEAFYTISKNILPNIFADKGSMNQSVLALKYLKSLGATEIIHSGLDFSFPFAFTHVSGGVHWQYYYSHSMRLNSFDTHSARSSFPVNYIWKDYSDFNAPQSIDLKESEISFSAVEIEKKAFGSKQSEVEQDVIENHKPLSFKKDIHEHLQREFTTLIEQIKRLEGERLLQWFFNSGEKSSDSFRLLRFAATDLILLQQKSHIESIYLKSQLLKISHFISRELAYKSDLFL